MNFRSYCISLDEIVERLRIADITDTDISITFTPSQARILMVMLEKYIKEAGKP